jgi:hypothetical protein
MCDLLLDADAVRAEYRPRALRTAAPSGRVCYGRTKLDDGLNGPFDPGPTHRDGGAELSPTIDKDDKT